MQVVLSHKVRYDSSPQFDSAIKAYVNPYFLFYWLAICGWLVQAISSLMNYHRVKSIALNLPCSSYGHQIPRRLPCPSQASLMLPPFLCRSPYGLGSIFSIYRHIVPSRPIALTSPVGELLPSWPFSSHASLQTTSDYGQTAICSSSLPFHKVSGRHAVYRLLKLRPLQLNWIFSITLTPF